MADRWSEQRREEEEEADEEVDENVSRDYVTVIPHQD